MIFKKISDFLDYIKAEYPNVKIVPVGMKDTAHSIYSDDTYENKIGELKYHYSTTTNSMFGYDYKFVK